MKLGVSGLAGSFSHAAALQAHPDAELVFLLDMEGVLAALEKREIDQGIFPVSNSVGGLVETAFEAMGRHLFAIAGQLKFEVHQCVLVHPQAEKIEAVASHPQALTQCARYLAQKPWQKIEWSDTASAARDLAAGKLPKNTAVLAPAAAAREYGLQLLESDVEDQKPNITTFLLVETLA
jgi:prephenate dehydratase